MTIVSLILNISISFILASMINRMGKSRNLFKSIFFLHNVVSVIATSILFSFLFYPTKAGVVNSVLQLVGFTPVKWFSGTGTSRLTVCIMGAWRMAGLQAVAKEQYEAAEVDGASGFQ